MTATGKVYYLPILQTLLLEDATIDFSMATPVINSMGTTKVTIRLKGNSTMGCKGTVISTRGVLEIVGDMTEAEQPSLTLKSQQTGIQASSNVTVSNAILKTSSTRYAIAGSSTGKKVALIFDHANTNLRGTMAALQSINEVICTNCGLLSTAYSGKNVLFDKIRRRMTVDGGDCKSLRITCDADYLVFDTGKTMDTWNMENAELVSASSAEEAAVEEPIVEEPVVEEPVVEEPVVEEPVIEEPTAEEALAAESSPTVKRPSLSDGTTPIRTTTGSRISRTPTSSATTTTTTTAPAKSSGRIDAPTGKLSLLRKKVAAKKTVTK